VPSVAAGDRSPVLPQNHPCSLDTGKIPQPPGSGQQPLVEPVLPIPGDMLGAGLLSAFQPSQDHLHGHGDSSSDGAVLPGTRQDEEQAWQRLITRAVPCDELPSIIETIFSGRETDMVDRLRGNDAQAFVDIMDEVCHHVLYFLDSLPFYILSFRHWMDPILHHISEINAWKCYTRRVLATFCFLDH